MMTEFYHLWTTVKGDPLAVILFILTIVYVAKFDSIYKCKEEEDKKTPRKLSKKERRRIEKAIDDAYKRMR